MPSHLTRQVFRRLLANEPIIHRACLRRRAYSCAASRAVSSRGPHRQHAIPTMPLEQRRSFFNFGILRKPKREMKEADMDPGLEKMMELEKLQRLRARLPAQEDVVKAFTDFFEAKQSMKQPVEDNQARVALQSLRYCLSTGEKVAGEEQRSSLSSHALNKAARALRMVPKQTTSDHLQLAQTLYERLVDAGPVFDMNGTQNYVMMLCRLGDASKARDVVLAYEQRRGPVGIINQMTGPTEDEDDEGLDTSDMKQGPHGIRRDILLRLWTSVLRGCAAQGEDADIARTLESIRERGLEASTIVAAAMLQYNLGRSDVEGVEHWWREYRRIDPRLRNDMAGALINEMLRWCLANERLSLGHRIVHGIMQTNPPKAVWDAIFVWAVGTGKGVDEIGRMLDVVERSNEGIADEKRWRTPDTATINALVEYAISKDDPYMAERFIALGRDRSVEPDAKTYVLQMEYRLRVNDIDGALTAYKNLQAMDLSSVEDVPAVNKIIVALCSSKRHDFDTVMNVAADLSDRRARFEPLTVATLSLLHLDRDELHDVIDLLNTHAFHYSFSERTTVRDMLVAYCLDPTTPVSRSWDAYTIIRNVFDELPREPRTRLMTAFFERDRPDMAVHVFNHMRAHSRADTLPTPGTYITAFLGTAQRRDLESLEVVHNQLKLDFNVTVTTRLRNALIIAYTTCGRPRKALGFWDEIVASREGPSYESIHIALRACERAPFGDLKAQEIWSKLRKMDVELDARMWASYVAALAGNGDSENAIRVLEEADGKEEVEVDAFVLGSLFMGTAGMEKQGKIEEWARRRYARQWTELEGLGVEEAEDGTRAFGIDRSVTP